MQDGDVAESRHSHGPLLDVIQGGGSAQRCRVRSEMSGRRLCYNGAMMETRWVHERTRVAGLRLLDEVSSGQGKFG